MELNLKPEDVNPSLVKQILSDKYPNIPINYKQIITDDDIQKYINKPEKERKSPFTILNEVLAKEKWNIKIDYENNGGFTCEMIVDVGSRMIKVKTTDQYHKKLSKHKASKMLLKKLAVRSDHALKGLQYLKIHPSFVLNEKVIVEENKSYEFKATEKQAYSSFRKQFQEEFGKNVCAFLNAKTIGSLLFGVNDEGRTVGVNIPDEQRDDLRLMKDNLMKLFYPEISDDQVRLIIHKIEKIEEEKSESFNRDDFLLKFPNLAKHEEEFNRFLEMYIVVQQQSDKKSNKLKEYEPAVFPDPNSLYVVEILTNGLNTNCLYFYKDDAYQRYEASTVRLTARELSERLKHS